MPVGTDITGWSVPLTGLGLAGGRVEVPGLPDPGAASGLNLVVPGDVQPAAVAAAGGELAGADPVVDDMNAAAGQGSRGRPRDNSANERVLFALVASRALKPSSKLAAADWVNNDVHIPGLPGTSDDACYRAMDWLHEIRGEIEKEIYYQVADLLNLEVDLLFFDYPANRARDLVLAA